MGFIRTVLGDIDPASLGITHLHEHLLTHPPSIAGDLDYTMPSEASAIAEVQTFQAQGGSALVEMTPRDYGRDPAGLQRVAHATGLHIIMVTGWLKEKFCAPHVQDLSVTQLADLLIHDIEEGIGGVKAGVIKAGSSLNKITANEQKCFQAAAIAQRQTRALISTHTEAGTMALEQVTLLTSLGVRPERILIGHTDRLLEWELHLALAQRGVTLGYDQISKVKYYPDSERLAFILRLTAAGFGDQLALSSDLARQSNWLSYGGQPGLVYLLRDFRPHLPDWERYLIQTPQRLLTIG
jgi:phosphotriesterase-related protein